MFAMRWNQLPCRNMLESTPVHVGPPRTHAGSPGPSCTSVLPPVRPVTSAGMAPNRQTDSASTDHVGAHPLHVQPHRDIGQDEDNGHDGRQYRRVVVTEWEQACSMLVAPVM
jgi:hypothetical protein